MKKLFYFIAIASISTLGFTSCSEDEPVVEIPTPNQNPNKGEALKLEPTGNNVTKLPNGKYYVKLGDAVTLKATSGTTAIADATFYVDGVKITGDSYNHGSIADVEIQAKRAGYLDSNTIIVQFAQKPH